MCAKEKTCEQLISGKLSDRLESLMPNIDEWTVDQCHNQIEEYGGAEMPDPNPWEMDAGDLLDLLEWEGPERVERERWDNEVIRAEVLTEINDEAIDGLDEWREAARESHQNECLDVLSIDKKTVYVVCMSWGGPADYFHLEHDGDDWTGGKYVYQDWFDGASQRISQEQAEQLAELWCIDPDNE